MKQLIYLLFVTILLSCNTSKNILSENTQQNTQEVETKDEIEIETETEIVIETEIITETEDETETIIAVTPQREAFNHSIWNTLLQKNVSNTGVVKYQGFRQQKGVLREYIASLGSQMPDESWTKEDKLAYWMNAYNAMTVDLIIRNLPLKSIKDIDKPWNQRLWKLGNKWYNLDEIEHKILRKMDEPRIHFGINCASFSCPPLLNKAFTRATVNKLLEELSYTFINDSTRNTIASDKVVVSKIFNWFGKDFKKDGTLIDFLNTYSGIKIDSNAKIKYMDYNWDLND